MEWSLGAEIAVSYYYLPLPSLMINDINTWADDR